MYVNGQLYRNCVSVQTYQFAMMHGQYIILIVDMDIDVEWKVSKLNRH